MQVRLRSDGSESVRYNNPNFPFYIYPGRLSSFENFSAVAHWHDDIELIYVQEGHMWYNVNGQVELLEAGEGVFVNSRQLHYGYSMDFSECEFLTLVIHPSLLATSPYLDQVFVSPFLLSPALPFCHLRPNVPWQRDMMACMQEAAALQGTLNPEFKYQILALSMWQCLMGNIPKTAEESPVRSQALAILKDMIRFIQKNFAERITLAEIAAAGNVSKSQCGVLFRQHTGQTPVEYLTEYRLREAAIQLRGGDAPIAQIALNTGFGGSSYFCEIFKRKHNMTPLQFRQRCNLLDGKREG